MRFIKVMLEGLSPLLCNSAVGGMDDSHPLFAERKELATKRKPTPDDMGRLRVLDAYLSLWRNPDDTPGFPPGGIRSAIEAAARKTKDGGLVREGMMVFGTRLDWDRSLGESALDIAQNEDARLTVPVCQGGKTRILRTRAVFNDWSLAVHIGYEPSIIEGAQIVRFLEIAGKPDRDRRLAARQVRRHLRALRSVR